jgi:hypothetical protein
MPFFRTSAGWGSSESPVADCGICRFRDRNPVTREEVKLISYCVTRTENFLDYVFSQRFVCTQPNVLGGTNFSLKSSRQVPNTAARWLAIQLDIREVPGSYPKPIIRTEVYRDLIRYFRQM